MCYILSSMGTRFLKKRENMTKEEAIVILKLLIEEVGKIEPDYYKVEEFQQLLINYINNSTWDNS